MTDPRKGTVSERLERRSMPITECGCIIWLGYCMPTGHGTIAIGSGSSKRMRLTHRTAWELHRGPIPKGMHVCHRCDVPSCINPDHLFLGTHADNMADMRRKGRGRRGPMGSRGISYLGTQRGWMAQITRDRKSKYIGTFKSRDEALAAYAAAEAIGVQ